MVWIQQQGEKKILFLTELSAINLLPKEFLSQRVWLLDSASRLQLAPSIYVFNVVFKGGKKQNFSRKCFINTYSISIEYTKTCLTLFTQSRTWNKSDVMTKSPKTSGYSSTCKITLTEVVTLFWLSIMSALFGLEVFFFIIYYRFRLK